MIKSALVLAALVVMWCCGNEGEHKDQAARKKEGVRKSAKLLTPPPACLCRLYEIDPGYYAADEYAADDVACQNPQPRYFYDVEGLPPQVCENEGDCDEFALRAKAVNHVRLSQPKAKTFQLQDYEGKYYQTKVDASKTKVVKYWIGNRPVFARLFAVTATAKDAKNKNHVKAQRANPTLIGFEIEEPNAPPDKVFSPVESQQFVKKLLVDNKTRVLDYQQFLQWGSQTYHIITTP